MVEPAAALLLLAVEEREKKEEGPLLILCCSRRVRKVGGCWLLSACGACLEALLVLLPLRPPLGRTKAVTRVVQQEARPTKQQAPRVAILCMLCCLFLLPWALGVGPKGVVLLQGGCGCCWCCCAVVLPCCLGGCASCV